MKAFIKKTMTGGPEGEEEEAPKATPPPASGPSTSSTTAKTEKVVSNKYLKDADVPIEPVHQPAAVRSTALTASEGEGEGEGEETGGAGPETKGQMVQRHKRELKAHQKAMAKLGKNKKDEKEKLEAEFEARQAREMRELEARQHQAAMIPADSAAVADDIDGLAQHKGQKQTKAQKRKEKLATKRAERDARIAQEHDEDGPSAREVEEEQLLALLRPYSLTIRDIKADGHCLYRALEDQLLQAGAVNPRYDYNQLRALAAAHMRQHPDDYIPFILEEDTQGDGAEQLEAYCKEVEATAAWGGQVELRALAAALQRCIRVHAVGMPLVTMGEEHASSGVVQLCYLRHAFGLGEHYNSLEPIDEEDEGEEEEGEGDEEHAGSKQVAGEVGREEGGVKEQGEQVLEGGGSEGSEDV